jgi:hypothetical protein
MIYLDSLGRIRSKRHGPLMTSWRCPVEDEVPWGSGGASLLVVSRDLGFSGASPVGCEDACVWGGCSWGCGV